MSLPKKSDGLYRHLFEDYKAGRLSRRHFIERATALGLGAGVALSCLNAVPVAAASGAASSEASFGEDALAPGRASDRPTTGKGNQKPRGNVLIPFGDGLNIGGGEIVNNTIVHFPNAYPLYLYLQSMGRIYIPVNAGVHKDTTTQMLARVQSDVIDHKPDYCIFLGGVNDVSAGVPLATTMANIENIWTQLQDAEIELIACTTFPKARQQNEVAAFNLAICELAAEMEIRCVDLHSVAVDPATGGILPAMDNDGVLTDAGHAAVATEIWKNIQDFFPPPGDVYLADDKVATAPRAMLANGVFVGDSNADGLADSWEVNAANGTWALSLIAGTGDVKGNWQQFTVSREGKRQHRQTLTTGWSVGDVLEFTGRFRITSMTGMTVDIRLDTQTSNVYFAHAAYNIAQPGEYIFRCRGAVPDGTTSVRPVIANSSTGTGTYAIAQCNLSNLTELGLV